MNYNLIKNVIAYLKLDTNITAYVGSNIEIEFQPIDVVDSKITVRVVEDKAEFNDTISGSLYINIWIRAKKYSTPFNRMKELKELVFNSLNFQGVALGAYNITQKSSTDIFESDSGIWRGILIFEYNSTIYV